MEGLKCKDINCTGTFYFIGPGDYYRVYVDGNPTDYKREKTYQCNKCKKIHKKK